MTDHVEARFEVKAPAGVIWAALADSRSWPTWSRNDSTALVREGVPAPDGVGAIRIFRTGRITVREEIVAFEPERRVAYRLLAGLPVEDYEGEVTLTPSPDQSGVTVLVWGSTWRPRYPLTGWALRLGIQQVVNRWSADLARHAEAVAARG
jgi:uncharacterized protein YndB with AHSA1/START domain